MIEQERRLVAPCVTRTAHPSRTLRYCLAEARPVVQGIFLLRYLAAVLLAADSGPIRLGHALLGAFGWWCATVAVYLFNGIADVPGDRLNGSCRPMAAGLLPVSSAQKACLWFAGLAAATCAAIGLPVLLFVLLLLGAGYFYSATDRALKRTSGGAALAIGLGGLLTYGAGFLSAAGSLHLSLPIFALSMSAWVGLVGSQAKDLSDVTGDALAGRRTLGVRFGEQALRRFVSAVALAVGAGSVLAAHWWAPSLLLSAVAVLLGAAVLAWVTLGADHVLGDRRTARQPYRVFMATQYTAHLLVLAEALT